MNANFSQLIRRSGLIAGAVFSLAGVGLYADTPAAPAGSTLTSDAFPTYDSYIKISGQGASITGDKAAFRDRMRQPENGSYGIEDLRYIKDLSKETNLTIDGRALSGAEDYLAQIRLTKNEVGSFEVGYKTFRTYYDGVGGFFPLNKEWMLLNKESLHTDRAKFWAQATINLPNQPVFTLRYTNELRDGKKDSTMWGSSDLTGLPFNLVPNPITPNRKIVPSYIQLNERHQTLEATVKHTIGKVTAQLNFVGDKANNLDSRFVTLFPGEVVPWSIASLSNTVPQTSTNGISPQAAAKAAAPATSWNNQVLQQQSDGNVNNTRAVTGKVDVAVSDKLSIHASGSAQLVHNAVTGDRPLVTTTDTPSGLVTVSTATFSGLHGNSRIEVYTGNITVNYDVTKDFTAELAFRSENEKIHGKSYYNVLAASGTPATTVASTPRYDWSKVSQHSTTPALELRYTGIKNISLYGTISKRDLSGEEHDTSSYNTNTAAGGTLANNDISENHVNWTVGAVWKACSAVELRAEAYDKDHQYGSTGIGLNVGDYYLLDSRFKGVKLTGILKPLPGLTFTTRFVHQNGDMSVTGYLPTYPSFDSCNAKNTNLGETIDWALNKAVYVQVSGNLVYNSIGTIYPRAGITNQVFTTYTTSKATVLTANAYDTNRVLQNSNNNYATANFIVGFVAGPHTDIQAQYTFYRANNGDAALAVMTQPYGAAERSSMGTVGVKHKLTDKLVLNAKVGYVDSKNDTTGGFTNFHGPLAYVSLDYAL